MIKAVGHVRPHAHVEPLGNPFQGHGGLGAKAFGHAYLAFVSFQGRSQVLLRPV